VDGASRSRCRAAEDLSPKEGVDNTRGNWVVFEASLLAAKFLLSMYFKDDPENYADAYELATSRAERLAAEKVLCQSHGTTFSKDSELNRAQSIKHVIRGVVVDGRNCISSGRARTGLGVDAKLGNPRTAAAPGSPTQGGRPRAAMSPRSHEPWRAQQRRPPSTPRLRAPAPAPRC